MPASWYEINKLLIKLVANRTMHKRRKKKKVNEKSFFPPQQMIFKECREDNYQK